MFYGAAANARDDILASEDDATSQAQGCHPEEP